MNFGSARNFNNFLMSSRHKLSDKTVGDLCGYRSGHVLRRVVNISADCVTDKMRFQHVSTAQHFVHICGTIKHTLRYSQTLVEKICSLDFRIEKCHNNFVFSKYKNDDFRKVTNTTSEKVQSRSIFPGIYTGGRELCPSMSQPPATSPD